MNIKDIINRERCTIQPRNQHARSILVAHNAALERIEAAVLKRITELEKRIAELDKRIAELEARLENAELEKATAEEAEALSRFRAERATVKIVPTTVRTEWYGRMW